MNPTELSTAGMAGGILSALIAGRNDPGFVHDGALAGLVAVCAGSDLMHPIGALATARFEKVNRILKNSFELCG